MRKKRLRVYYTSADETGQVRPAADSGNNVVRIRREQVTYVEVKPVDKAVAHDSNSVQITLAKRVVGPGSDKDMCLAAASSIHVCDDETSLVSDLGSKSADGARVALSVSSVPHRHVASGDSGSDTKFEPAHSSKLRMWLLAAAIFSVTTTFTVWSYSSMPGVIAHTGKMSNQTPVGPQTGSSAPLVASAVKETGKIDAEPVADAAGTRNALTGSDSESADQPKSETAKSGLSSSSTDRVVCPPAPPNLMDVERLTVEPSTASDASGALAGDVDETGSGGSVNQDSNQVVTLPSGEMPKAAASKTSKARKGLMVPPPPPTPCVLPPAFDFFLRQPAQQHAAHQQQLPDAQAEASVKTDKEAAAQEKIAEEELKAADQELEAALRSSARTVGEWTR